MKIPIKTKRIELDGDYEGGWVDIRTNPPAGELLDSINAIQEANQENVGDLLPPVYGVLEMTIQAWNFTDTKDKDLPCDTKGLKSLPIDLLVLLTTKIQEAIVGLPLANSTR